MNLEAVWLDASVAPASPVRVTLRGLDPATDSLITLNGCEHELPFTTLVLPLSNASCSARLPDCLSETDTTLVLRPTQPTLVGLLWRILVDDWELTAEHGDNGLFLVWGPPGEESFTALPQIDPDTLAWQTFTLRRSANEWQITTPAGSTATVPLPGSVDSALVNCHLGRDIPLEILAVNNATHTDLLGLVVHRDTCLLKRVRHLDTHSEWTWDADRETLTRVFTPVELTECSPTGVLVNAREVQPCGWITLVVNRHHEANTSLCWP